MCKYRNGFAKIVSLSIHCLQGLIETDGSIYTDRGYQMVIFSTVIAELAQQVELMMRSLGFRPHVYKVRQDPSQGTAFQVSGAIEQETSPGLLELDVAQ